MHVVFRELNGKTLSLTWSKKNILIGSEALHQDPRPKTQDHARAQAEPSRPDGGGARAWGALSSSELFNLSCHEDIYILLKINSPNQCGMLLTSFH